MKIIIRLLLLALFIPPLIVSARTSDEIWGQQQTLQEIRDKALRIKAELIFMGVEKTAIVSAYNSEVGQTDDTPFIMASGRHVYDGAVANNCHPFGTKLIINDKTYTVWDRMNSRYDCDHYDIWMESKADALHFGRQTLPVVVVDML